MNAFICNSLQYALSLMPSLIDYVGQGFLQRQLIHLLAEFLNYILEAGQNSLLYTQQIYTYRILTTL
jgi:hypothetical protein